MLGKAAGRTCYDISKFVQSFVAKLLKVALVNQMKADRQTDRQKDKQASFFI